MFRFDNNLFGASDMSMNLFLVIIIGQPVY